MSRPMIRIRRRIKVGMKQYIHFWMPHAFYFYGISRRQPRPKQWVAVNKRWKSQFPKRFCGHFNGGFADGVVDLNRTFQPKRWNHVHSIPGASFDCAITSPAVARWYQNEFVKLPVGVTMLFLSNYFFLHFSSEWLESSPFTCASLHMYTLSIRFQ